MADTTTPTGTVLACPECSYEEVGESDVIPGVAQGAWEVSASGSPMFVPGGYTDVCWDGQEVVEAEPCFCPSCCWSGTPDQLVPVDGEDE